MTTPGKVWLVGAGPGDPGLITMAGVARLAAAEVVVYDRLVNQVLLKHAPAGAEMIYAGKSIEGHTLSQADINALLIAKAKEGKRVVRLKGGDPFVFGRGGEEAEALAEAGMPFGVVPGVTSAVAVPAYAGIPLTHRNIASSFLVATGHEAPEKDGSSLSWDKLALAADTLVFLMGRENLSAIAQQLLAHGRPPATPAAAIHWGTLPRQRTVTGTLEDIAAKVDARNLPPPAVLVVGEAVSLRDALRWYDNAPLFGKRVLVTRAREQASALVRLLAEEGAEVMELPAIAIHPLASEASLGRPLERLSGGDYAWVVFTSVNAVDIFFQHVHRLGRDARIFGKARICTIGPASAQALEERGVVADAVPEEYAAEGILAAMQGRLASGQRVLLPRADGARPELVSGLGALGAEVDEVILYRAELPSETDQLALERVKQGEADVLTFASSSTVRNLVEMLDGRIEPLAKAVVACIGPVTAEAARRYGLQVDIIAQEYTIPGLVRELKEYFSKQKGGTDGPERVSSG